MPDLPPESRAGLTNFRRYTWWSLTGTTSLFLAVLVGAWLWDRDTSTPVTVLLVAALGVTAVASMVGLHHRLAAEPPHPPRAWLGIGAFAAVVLGAVLLAAGNDGLWSFPPAIMVSVVATFLAVRWRRALVAGAAVAAGLVGGVVAWGRGDGLGEAIAIPVGMVLFVAWVTLGALWAWDVAERLDRAQGLAAELAVKDERLRFAADLHDIQGHHLQVIAMKSELAARLVEVDQVRAVDEMGQVRGLALDALWDTRAVVHGYRRTTLAEEITNATRVLASAGIDARLTSTNGAELLSARDQQLLGLVMREATTNVLRHSRATHTEVDYQLRDGVALLRVCNDGVAHAGSDSGSGLAALGERLTTAGGELSWQQRDGSFTVTATLPLAPDAEESP